jgi:hypothetical protein
MRRLLYLIILLLCLSTVYGVNTVTQVRKLKGAAAGDTLSYLQVRDSLLARANAYIWLYGVLDTTSVLPTWAEVEDSVNAWLSDLGIGAVTTSEILDGTIAIGDLSPVVRDSATLMTAHRGTGTYRTYFSGSAATVSELITAAGVYVSASNTGNPSWINAAATTVLHGGVASIPTFSGVVSTDIIDATIAKADLADALVRKIVPLVNIHQPRYVRAANDTLTLEIARTDTAYTWMVIGGAADQKGSHLMTVTIPAGVTLVDSIFFGYQTSSATNTTSAIDSVSALVTSGGISPTWQASLTTDMHAVAQTAVWWALADADFNEGERVVLKFFTNVDANEWVGLINCYLVCR